MPHINISSGTGFYIFLAFVFIVLNAFFVAAEFAIVKIRHTRLKVLAKRGDPIAKLAYRIVNHLDAYLSATQLGITLASLGLGWIGEPAFARVIKQLIHFFGGYLSESTLHSVSFVLAFLLISAMHIILGELVPKSLALRTAEKICLVIALPLRIFYLIFYPFLWVLNGTANLFLRLFHLPNAQMGGRAHTEEELKLIFEDSFEDGVIASDKRMLLDKALDFSHKTVKDIMVPREKVIFFHLKEGLHQNLERVKSSGHTRFPLMTDNEGPITGFIHMKDIIWGLENEDVINLFDLKRPLIYFDQEAKINFALKEFQKKKIHMGIVLNSDRQALGLVTLEDVIEELVGEIEDEFDELGH